MADVAHRNLTGADLHEPKGITGAASGQVYVADGLGSGAWGAVPTDNSVGEIYSLANVVTSVGIAGTYYRWTPTAGVSDLSQNITVLATSGTFTATVAGVYRLSFQGAASVTGDEAEPVLMKFRVAGADQDPPASAQKAFVQDAGQFHISKLVSLSIGQSVDVAVSNTTGDTVTIEGGMFQIEKVG